MDAGSRRRSSLALVAARPTAGRSSLALVAARPTGATRVRGVGERRLVVGAAIVRGARVLAARRTTPAEAAGRWELPGGKVEPGEQPADALEREIAEELGCEIEVTAWLGGTSAIGDHLELRVAVARLVDGEPEPHEHDRLTWVGADELDGPDGLDWMDADRPFLPELRARAAPAEPRPRRAAARCSSTRTTRPRCCAACAPTATTPSSSASAWPARTTTRTTPGRCSPTRPQLLVEMLVDEHDGWLDDDAGAPAPPPVAPLDLPTAPRRIKRPGAALLGSRPCPPPPRPPATSASCSCTPTPTTSRSARAPRWPSTPPRAAASPW